MRELGVLETDPDVPAGTDEITTGPSGVEFFRVTFPPELAAWRLWTRTDDNDTVETTILTNALEVPLAGRGGRSEEEITTGAGLLGPEEFEFRAGRFYFVAVYADPGETFILESREQIITDLAFNSTTDEIQSTGFPIQTYRVEVPIDQLAWEVTTRASSGDPDIFVRRSFVPTFEANRPANPGDATFRSEVLGDSSDSITLVPNLLSDGTYFISVLPKDLNSSSDLVYTLFNGQPEITDLEFNDSRINDDPDRAGWRFYRVVDIDQQLGQLGWLITLDNYIGQEEGDDGNTEIFIRRNAAPGNGRNLFEERSSAGFLQDPEHEADVWYIGIYNPTAALGEFTITSSPINPPSINFDGGQANRGEASAVPPDQWSFIRVDVPETVNGEDVLGWEIRLSDWVGVRPALVVRRAILAENTATRDVGVNSVIFPAGAQIAANGDWTRRNSQPASAGDIGADQVISLPMGNPLEAGTYYVGIRNLSPTDSLSYTLTSRGIGNGMSLSPVPLSLGSDEQTVSLDPRQVQYFTFDITDETPFLELELDALTEGSEGALLLREGFLPTTLTTGAATTEPYSTNDRLPGQTRLDIVGDERTIILPPDDLAEGEPLSLPAGTYYALVASQGRNPQSTGVVGEDPSRFTLKTSITPSIESLGSIARGQTVIRDAAAENGQTVFYSFDLPENSSALTLTFQSESAGAQINFRPFTDGQFPSGRGYGVIGGADSLRTLTDGNSFTLSSPPAGSYVVAFRSSSSGEAPEGRFTVTNEEASIIDANDGEVTNTLEPGRWAYYRISIPETLNNVPVLGWEGRLSEWSYSEAGEVTPVVEFQRTTFPDQTARRVSATDRTFPEGQRVVFTRDWTGYTREPGGRAPGADLISSLPLGNPLQAGDYIIGVRNPSSTEDLTFTLQSRLIGAGPQFGYRVTPLAQDSDVNISSLPARSVAYYQVVISEPTSVLQLELENVLPTNGDGRLLVREGLLPSSLLSRSFSTRPYGVDDNLQGQTLLAETGSDRVTILKQGPDNLVPAGTYYLLVVSEGREPNGSQVGSGSVSFSLSHSSSVGLRDLELITTEDFVRNEDVTQGGENHYYRFEIPDGVRLLTVSLANPSVAERRTEPLLSLRRQDDNCLPGRFNVYGLIDGVTGDQSIRTRGSFTLSRPPAGEFVFLVRGQDERETPYRVTISTRPEEDPTTPLDFDGGRADVVGLTPGLFNPFRVEVPAQVDGEDVLGWEMRISNWQADQRPEVQIVREEYPALRRGDTVRRDDRSFPPLGLINFKEDWSLRNQTIDGQTRGVDLVATLPMGNPLEPGTYLISVRNTSAADFLSYTITSRGIGRNMSRNVREATFGEEELVIGIDPREPRYFRYTLTEPVPAMQLSALLQGESADATDFVAFIRKDFIPSSLYSVRQSQTIPYNYDEAVLSSHRSFEADGSEFTTFLPGQTGRGQEAQQQETIPAGEYFVQLVGQGAPRGTRIGLTPADVALNLSIGVPVEDLGTLVPTETVTREAVAEDGSGSPLEAGQVKVLKFTVPPKATVITLSIEDSLRGSAHMLLRSLADNLLPGDQSSYGLVAGPEPDQTIRPGSPLSLAAPAPGDYALLIRSSNSRPIDYTVDITLQTATELAFDGGSVSEQELDADERAYFVVDVPMTIAGEPVLGWETRLTNWEGSRRIPEVTIRRDLAPETAPATTLRGDDTRFSSEQQISATLDWTGRSPNNDPADQIISLPMGNPLEPGRYFISVRNTDSSSPITFSLQSRGIGRGMSLNVLPLQAEEITAMPPIAPRDLQYFTLNLEEETEAMNLHLLLPNVGDEASVIVRKDFIPFSARASRQGLLPFSYDEEISDQLLVRKEGGERTVLLGGLEGEEGNLNTLPAGNYYFMIISEGANPASIGEVGAAAVSPQILVSLDDVPEDLGLVTSQQPIQITRSVEVGEVGFINFELPEDNPWPVHLRLTGVNSSFPASGTWRFNGGFSGLERGSIYGLVGGLNDEILTNRRSNTEFAQQLTGPQSFHYRANRSSSESGDISIEVKVKEPLPLSLDRQLNGTNLTNQLAGSLAPDEFEFFEVTFPETINGEPVLGWRLTASSESRRLNMTVSKNQLPVRETNADNIFSQSDNRLILNADQISPGTYFVALESRATESISYTLFSDALTTADVRRDWTMPVEGELSTTPGLPNRIFGDTGIDPNGRALSSEDQGVDLGRNGIHLYSVTIPEENEGIFRIQLDAISGNPDLTVNQTVLAAPGTNSDFALSSDTETEYGNWVPLDTKLSDQLPAGRYLILVSAESDTNARYRLRLSTGNIVEIDQDGGLAQNLTFAAGDWFYAKVRVPLDLPDDWNVTYSLSQGRAEFFVRDEAPPGQGFQNGRALTRSWIQEAKNQGSYTSYRTPGTYTLRAPQVRPGSVYYLGFLASADTTLAVRSEVSEAFTVDPESLSAFGGRSLGALEPGEVKMFKTFVPEGQEEFYFNLENSSAISVYVEQGSFPTLSSSDDAALTGRSNIEFSEALGDQSWPYVASQTFYISLLNTGTSVESFDLTVGEGAEVLLDSDGDGLPDDWELLFLGGLQFGPGNAPDDGDSTPLLLEYFFGLDPRQSDEPDLLVTADGRDAVITFTKRAELPTLDYVVERDANLISDNWSERQYRTRTNPVDEDFEQVELRDLLGTNPKNFYRLRVSVKEAE